MLHANYALCAKQPHLEWAFPDGALHGEHNRVKPSGKNPLGLLIMGANWGTFSAFMHQLVSQD